MKMRELLADKSRWTQGVYARDKDGLSVDFDSPAAICWCISAAFQKCYGPFTDRSAASLHPVWERIKAATEELGFWYDAISINETLGYDAVMQILEKADV